jgi:hypothetical protein
MQVPRYGRMIGWCSRIRHLAVHKGREVMEPAAKAAYIYREKWKKHG